MRARFIRFTYPVNITGQPAISLPTGCTADGLPVGLQPAVCAWEDEFPLAVTDRFQAATMRF